MCLVSVVINYGFIGCKVCLTPFTFLILNDYEIKCDIQLLFVCVYYSVYFNFVYDVQRGETPLVRAVNGNRLRRAGRCKVVKYFIQRKKVDISQFRKVM